MRVVDVLEVIEIEQGQGDDVRALLSEEECELLVQRCPVGQTGEGVLASGLDRVDLPYAQTLDRVLLVGAGQDLAEDEGKSDDDADDELRGGQAVPPHDDADGQSGTRDDRQHRSGNLEQAGRRGLMLDQAQGASAAERSRRDQQQTGLCGESRPGRGGVPAVQRSHAVADVRHREQGDPRTRHVQEGP